jgi:transcription antitermination factor NusG
MNIDPSPERWYALQLRTRWESSTATLLSGKGYQTFLPTYKTLKRVRGKSCEVGSPLFPGYVFCRFDAHKRLPVLLTPGVISVVGRGRIPIPVEDSEIDAIQKVVSTGVQAEPWPYLEVGQLVRIDDGALCGVEGILIGFKGARRIVVSVSLLRRSVALEIDRSVVCAIQPALTVPSGPLPFSTLLEPAVA